METQTEDLKRLKEEYRIEFLQKKIKRLIDKMNYNKAKDFVVVHKVHNRTQTLFYERC